MCLEFVRGNFRSIPGLSLWPPTLALGVCFTSSTPVDSTGAADHDDDTEVSMPSMGWVLSLSGDVAVSGSRRWRARGSVAGDIATDMVVAGDTESAGDVIRTPSAPKTAAIWWRVGVLGAPTKGTAAVAAGASAASDCNKVVPDEENRPGSPLGSRGEGSERISEEAPLASVLCVLSGAAAGDEACSASRRTPVPAPGDKVVGSSCGTNWLRGDGGAGAKAEGDASGASCAAGPGGPVREGIESAGAGIAEPAWMGRVEGEVGERRAPGGGSGEGRVGKSVEIASSDEVDALLAPSRASGAVTGDVVVFVVTGETDEDAEKPPMPVGEGGALVDVRTSTRVGRGAVTRLDGMLGLARNEDE